MICDKPRFGEGFKESDAGPGIQGHLKAPTPQGFVGFSLIGGRQAMWCGARAWSWERSVPRVISDSRLVMGTFPGVSGSTRP